MTLTFGDVQVLWQKKIPLLHNFILLQVWWHQILSLKKANQANSCDTKKVTGFPNLFTAKIAHAFIQIE